MNIRQCMIGILFFVSMKAELSVADLFKALISKAPIYQSLLPVQQNVSIDVHMVSRFLKELQNYPCLLLADSCVDQHLVQELFPQAIVYIVPSDKQDDLLIKQVDSFLQAHGDYAVILTHLSSSSRQLSSAILQSHPSLCCLDINTLLNHANIDVKKLLRLMKRKIHIVCTAALIPIKFKERMAQYIRGLSRIIDFGYHPYIVETCKSGATFLDDISRHVFYSQSNDSSIKNKGVNEFKSLIHAFQEWHFHDDDIILKFTGRYFFLSDAFIRLLEDADDIDCAAKFVTVPAGPCAGVDAVLTGCFAMRFKMFKSMLEFFDYEMLERDFVCVEHVVGPYLNDLKKQNVHVARCEILGVEANMFGNEGTDVISYW